MDPEPKPTKSLPVKKAKPAADEKHFEDFGTSARGAYLALYNLLSAVLWAFILGRVISIAPTWGNTDLNRTTGSFVKWVQTLAVLEIFHSLFGKVPLILALRMMPAVEKQQRD